MKRKTHPKWPEAPTNSIESLMHVLDIFEGEPDSMPIIAATTNIYAPHGEPDSWTGLRLGDLRVLADMLNDMGDRLAMRKAGGR